MGLDKGPIEVGLEVDQMLNSKVGMTTFMQLHQAEAKASDVVITDMILICHMPTLTLFDPGSTYSYASVYYASRLSLCSETLSALLCVLTPWVSLY